MELLGIFAKFWQPGRVKTRLAAHLGEVAASELYRAFLEASLSRFSQFADRRTLVYTPLDRQREFAELAANRWILAEQGNGDLGERMRRFFLASFGDGARRVVLIGSDSPTLPSEYIENAFAALKTHSVVLGPATDGGYYLIGAAEEVPPIFDGISWSEPTVLQNTILQLEEADIKYATLPAWYDVDELDDLVRLDRELRELTNTQSGWGNLIAAVQAALDGKS